MLTSDGPVDADLVVLGIGVQPRSELAKQAGIELGVAGAVHIDDHQATSAEHVWSAGDCAESIHRLTGQPVYIPLGTYANRHGRVAGLNMAGGDVRSAPVLGTGITKLCRARHRRDGAARGGGDRRRLRRHRRHDRHDDRTPATSREPDRLTVRLTVERGTGRLLGAQLLGGSTAAKRIDTVATAITAEMTVAEVADLDLAYAPPFSSVWDPVAVAAREAMKAI